MSLRINSFKQAAFWSTAINGFSQGLALLFSMVMAAMFGAQESTDVLYYCTGIFMLLTTVLQAANVSVLIPETMRRRHQVSEADAMAFINRFFAVFAVIITALGVGLLTKPIGVVAFISKFSPDVLQRNERLLFWLLASLPLQMTAQLLLDVLVSYKYLTLPAMLSCVNRVLNILFVLLFHRQLGVLSVALGMLLWFALQVAINGYLLRRAIRWNLRVWRTHIGGQVFRNIAWVEGGTVASTLAGYLPLFLFSGFSAGLLTALNYARRLSAVPTELLTVQLTSVLGIKFNELAAQRQQEKLGESLGHTLRLAIFLLVPVSVLLALVSQELVDILFAHGAFRGAAVGTTALLFALLVLALPLIGVSTILGRYFVARQAIGYGTAWQTFSALLNAALVIGAVHVWGPVGFPIALLVHGVLYLACLSPSLTKRFPGLPIAAVWRSLVATSVAASVAALLAWTIRQFIHFPSPWLRGGTTAFLFFIFWGLWISLRSPDAFAWQYYRNLVQSVWRRRLGLTLPAK